jgi:hypothetical protein
VSPVKCIKELLFLISKSLGSVSLKELKFAFFTLSDILIATKMSKPDLCKYISLQE